eukprot:scpid59411/ scgid16182/ Putative sodium-coupled neutral amino acid transporter 7
MSSGERKLLITSGGGDLESPDLSINQPGVSDPAAPTNSFFGATFIVINASIGAGLLSFPYAFLQAGVIPAIFIQLGFVVFIGAALLILAYCAERTHAMNYQQVVEKCCGTTLGVICQVCVVIYCFGACVTFFVVIGDQLDSMLRFAAGTLDHWYLDRRFTTSVVSIVVAILSFFRNISYLSKPSSAGVFAMVYLVIVVVVRYGTKTYPPLETPIHFEHSWSVAFGAIPVICFGFQCHVSAVPVYHALSGRSVRRFAGVVALAMGLNTTLYTLAGAFGAMSFGDGTCSDILVNYTPTDKAITAARVALAFNIVTSYPILHYCGRAAFFDLYVRIRSLPPVADELAPEPPAERVRRYVASSIWLVTSLLIAINVSDVKKVIEPFGGLAACFIFAFPGLCLFNVAFDLTGISARRRQMTIATGVLFLLIGMFIFGENLTLVAMRDSGAIGSGPPCASLKSNPISPSHHHADNYTWA